MNFNFAIVILTYNAINTIESCLRDIIHLKKIIYCFDSSSTDGTQEYLNKNKINVKIIPKKLFDHSGTRNLAYQTLKNQYEYLVYITQDSYINSESLESLLSSFDNPKIAVAYGRQMPHKNADPFAIHSRMYNYPSISKTNFFSKNQTNDISTAFNSNSYSSYRVKALEDIGGFPIKNIVSEDLLVSAMLLLKGWGTCYNAHAIAAHSHNLTLIKEFKRYFDIGVSHYENRNVFSQFTNLKSEGLKFVISELKFLYPKSKYLILISLIKNILKFCGFFIGKKHFLINKKIKFFLSDSNFYFDNS